MTRGDRDGLVETLKGGELETNTSLRPTLPFWVRSEVPVGSEIDRDRGEIPGKGVDSSPLCYG